MSIDPAFLTAIGDVFLNLAAGWFGTAIIIPGTYPRPLHVNALYVAAYFFFGVAALAIGYRFRILGGGVSRFLQVVRESHLVGDALG